MCYRYYNKENNLLKKDMYTMYIFYIEGASGANAIMDTFISVVASQTLNCIGILIKCNNTIIPMRIFIKFWKIKTHFLT